MNASTRLSQEFLDHALDFRDAAARLCEDTPFLYHPTFYCVLHSIELALKAHLSCVGTSKRELASKKLGHNLASLVNMAAEKGTLDTATVNAHARKAIAWGGKDYSKKCFEYPEFMLSTLPIGRWLVIAGRVIKSAQKLIAKA